MQDRGSTFVLVHGAWHGGWCWKGVADRLRAAGHEVFTPTLTGLGDRSHLFSPGITLSVHVRDIVNLIRWEELSDIVLCGHSYGGLVISGVAGQLADRLRALVFVDALVPQHGQNLLDCLTPEIAAAFDSMTHDGQVQVPPVSMFTNEAAEEPGLQRRLTPHPAASFREAATGTDAVAAFRRKVYVLASGRPSVASVLAERLQADPAWKVEHIEGGHDLMIDAPDRLSHTLMDAADGACAP